MSHDWIEPWDHTHIIKTNFLASYIISVKQIAVPNSEIFGAILPSQNHHTASASFVNDSSPIP